MLTVWAAADNVWVHIQNLKENLGALSIKLSPEDVAEIRRAAKAADAAWQGDRYPAELVSLLFVDTPPLKE
ncbi:hypothetical protein NUW54_g6358 [Trametes sanguinea]|nr:hypothetical protein NUW54_g6358 [Trametes sanguinea]